MKREKDARLGYLAAIAAYFSWGVLPGYWKALQSVSSLEILCHRIVWSLASLLVYYWLRKLKILPLLTRRNLVVFGASGLLIAANWFTYIVAVNTGHVLEASLGYFMNPLVNVLLGRFAFGEELTRVRIVSFALAFVGVIFLGMASGGVPWISLILVATFSAYGVIRKTAQLDAIGGLFIETVVLFLPALAYLIFKGEANVLELPLLTGALLVGSGAVTAFPLLWFAVAARNLPLSSLGFLQYLSPTMQFLLAVLVYREEFTLRHLASFSLIWLGLGLFVIETVFFERKRSKIGDH